MRQRTLADEGFEMFRKPIHREQFLDEMEQLIPWRDRAPFGGIVLPLAWYHLHLDDF